MSLEEHVKAVQRYMVAEEKVRQLELQISEVWELLDSMPSGPGEGAVSCESEVRDQIAWSDKYRALKLKHGITEHPRCHWDGGTVPCDYQKPCPDHSCACCRAVAKRGDKCLKCGGFAEKPKNEMGQYEGLTSKLAPEHPFTATELKALQDSPHKVAEKRKED
jgi:hypothetical protein